MNSHAHCRFALAVLIALALAAVAGWFVAPGNERTTTAVSPAPAASPQRADARPATIPAGSPVPTAQSTVINEKDWDIRGSGATALILAAMIAGAAGIGAVFFAPAPHPANARGPQMTGVLDAAVAAVACLAGYSSIAPGAFLETWTRNSRLFLLFFNRSISRSIA